MYFGSLILISLVIVILKASKAIVYPWNWGIQKS